MDEINGQTLAKAAGFSLHAGVSAKSYQRHKVERLCRYIVARAGSSRLIPDRSTVAGYKPVNEWSFSVVSSVEKVLILK